MNFLYGAAVQGIQQFIFQTNELKDIAGASELVEQICTSAFLEEFGNGGTPIVNAAGNIKYIFTDEKACRNAVLNFPKKVMEMAPGITISQAVVKFETDFASAVNELERRLRAQRNKPMPSMTVGLMGIQRSRQTGLPCVKFIDEKPVDDAVAKKKAMSGESRVKVCANAFGTEEKEGSGTFFLTKEQLKQIAHDINDITREGVNDWIAVIHADGNGLGQIIQQIGTKEDEFSRFSKMLDRATKLAAQAAYRKIQSYFVNHIPIRPIVLSGDDFTVICRADFAVEYVSVFIEEFEKETGRKKADRDGADELGDILSRHDVFNEDGNKLSACAGIAFIKSSYPFYYGYQLAEALCSEAKKDAKKGLGDGKLPQSCLMFHKVQDSFIESYADIEARELTPSATASWKFGPYYIHEKNGYWTVGDLLSNVNLLCGKEGNAVKSHLRQWLSLMHENPESAKQKADRVGSLLKNDLNNLVGTVVSGTGLGRTVEIEEKKGDETEKRNVEVKKYPVYDMLAVHSVKNLKTNDKLYRCYKGIKEDR